MADAVRRCRQDREFLFALREIYDLADAANAARAPVCLGGGACCRFDLAGHRLMLSTGELALLSRAGPGDPSRAASGRCPYQSGPRCLARDHRPLGCRIYFCRDDDADRSGQTYEALHRRVCDLHRARGLPYFYVELTSALSELHSTGCRGHGVCGHVLARPDKTGRATHK